MVATESARDEPGAAPRRAVERSLALAHGEPVVACFGPAEVVRAGAGLGPALVFADAVMRASGRATLALVDADPARLAARVARAARLRPDLRVRGLRQLAPLGDRPRLLCLPPLHLADGELALEVAAAAMHARDAAVMAVRGVGARARAGARTRARAAGLHLRAWLPGDRASFAVLTR